MWGAIAGAAIGFGANLLASSQKDKAEKKSSKQVKKVNKKIYDAQSKLMKWKRDIDIHDVTKNALHIEAAQKAGYSARGVKSGGPMGENTADLVMRETLNLAQRDIERIKTQWAYDDKVAYTKYEAGQAAATPTTTFNSTLLTSGSQFVAGGFGTDEGGWYGLFK